jgi:DNA polymerase
MAEPTRNRDLDDAIASLRRFLRARWEERDDVLFRTTAPLPLVPPAAARPGLRTPTPPQGVLRAATPAARPAYPAPAFRTAPPLPRPLAARPGGGRASVERHESGILNPNGSDRAKALLELYERIKTCESCGLRKGCQHFVFGTGSPEARIVFVGEAPGEQEDKQGLPFVGAAGRLLNELLAGIGVGRDDVFICNVIKCRPPGNRKPELPEIEACELHLYEQLRIIAPRILVALGTFAAQSLLQTTQPIGRLRGRWLRWKDSDLLATYHPSAGLRAGSFKKVIEEDFLVLQKRLAKDKAGPS